MPRNKETKIQRAFVYGKLSADRDVFKCAECVAEKVHFQLIACRAQRASSEGQWW